jgi:hypothetical protein
MSSVAGQLWESTWRKRYLRHLRTELQAVLPGVAKEAVRHVRCEARRTVEARRAEIPDPQGLMVISSASLVLASYREITRHGIAEAEARELIGRVFRRVFAVPTSRATRLLLRFTPDPVAEMNRHSIAPLFRVVFGRLFTFDEHHTDAGVVLTVSHCGFNDFFTHEGEPQLTRLICAWDRNWLQPMDSSDRPIATRRSQTLSTGAPRCEFHFDSAEPRPAPTVDVALDH